MSVCEYVLTKLRFDTNISPNSTLGTVAVSCFGKCIIERKEIEEVIPKVRELGEVS